MKILVPILLFCFSSWFAKGQNIEKFSIDSGGAITNNGGFEILYTIGEVNVQELDAVTVLISEGFIGSDFNSNTLSASVFDQSDIVVYPNPASSVIKVSSSFVITKLELLDVSGKLILVSNSSATLKVSDLHQGTYILKIHTLYNVFTKKLIISK